MWRRAVWKKCADFPVESAAPVINIQTGQMFWLNSVICLSHLELISDSKRIFQIDITLFSCVASMEH